MDYKVYLLMHKTVGGMIASGPASIRDGETLPGSGGPAPLNAE
jgi:hypothetical protein